jgi:hypothetical protein
MAGKVKADELFDLDKFKKDLEATKKLLIDNDEALKEFMKSMQEGSKTIKDSQTANENLGKAKKNLSEAEKEAIRVQKDAEKILIDKQKAENAELGTLERLQAANRNLAKERNKLNLETDTGKKRLGEINSELDKNNKTIKDNVDSLGKQRLNIGNYKSALEGLPEPLKNAGDSVGGLGKQFIALMMNPIALFIAAIVGGLYALFKAFISTDEGAVKFAQVMESIKAVLDVVRQRLAQFADGVVSLFKGEWSEAAKQFGNAFEKIGEQMKSAVNAAFEYQRILDEIGDSESNYVSQSAENRNKIAKLEFISKDQTKTIEERKAALQEAMKLSEEESKKSIQLAKNKLEAEINYLALKSDSRNKVNAQEILDFIKMTDEQQKSAKKSLQIVRNNNEAKFDELEKMYGSMIDADTRYFDENKKNNAKLSQFTKDEIDKRHKYKVDQLKAERDAIGESANYDQEIRKRNEKAAADEMARLQKQESEKLKLEKEIHDNKIRNIDIEYLKSVEASSKDYLAKKKNGSATLEDEKTYSNKILEAKKAALVSEMLLEKDNMDKYLELQNQLNELEIKQFEDKEKEKQAAIQQTFDLTKQGVSAITGLVNQMYDNEIIEIQAKNATEIEESQARRERELKAHKDDKDAIAKINKKYDDQQKAIEKKNKDEEKKVKIQQFNINKAEKAINAGIEIALNIIKASNPAMAWMIPWISAIGAIQLGTILAAKAPAYKEGTEFHEGGLAIVGDGGMSELIKTPDSKWYLSPNTSTVLDLPRGSKVIKGEETQKLMGGSSIDKYHELLKEQKETTSAIKKIKILNTNFTENGIERIVTEGNSRTKLQNKYA